MTLFCQIDLILSVSVFVMVSVCNTVAVSQLVSVCSDVCLCDPVCVCVLCVFHRAAQDLLDQEERKELRSEVNLFVVLSHLT